MFEENARSEEGLLLFQKAASYQQNKLYSFLQMSCLCLAAMLRRCFVLWEAKGKRFTIVRTPMHMLFKLQSFYWVELRQALKPAGTVMIRSLCSYYRVCFSTESTHAVASMRKEVHIGTTAHESIIHCPSADWSWVAWGRHVSLPRQINGAKPECIKNAIFLIHKDQS